MYYQRKAVVLLLVLQYCVWFSLAGKISGAEDINFGLRKPSWAPIMQMSANISDIESIRSFFEFRTLDPEGIIFYGDTKEGKDWFVLLLRDGIPEMQIGKANTLVSVQGGPTLNDGVWYNLELRSEGPLVILEVNKRTALVVAVESDQTEVVLSGTIRLALGGMLVDKTKLLQSFNPALDACIRKGNWLNFSTPWDKDLAWELQPCFPEIKRGSYFPGTGKAVFNTTDLPGVETEEKGITIEVYGSWQGTLLSLQSPGFEYVMSELEEYKKNKDLTMELKEGSESGNTALSPETTRLTLTILKHSLMLNGNTLLKDERVDLLSRWREGMLLTFGGLPGENKQSSHRLQGCLEKILIQGRHIDLDQASFKHASISSHSCPAKALNELT